jgi:glycerophosphoryl diester phosphodiesterase
MPSAMSEPRPLIIAHRGASGERPEHTLESYTRAIDQGADYIEPDLVSTKDGVLVARHENEIGGTTDVAAKFPARRTTKIVDGDTIDGWFVEDFTLAEVKTLRARERLSHRSHVYDGQFVVPTFNEVLQLVRTRERQLGRTIGVYPELKHPSYFRELGLSMEQGLLDALASHGWRDRNDAVFIQVFEVATLRALRGRTSIRLVLLVNDEGRPWDFVASGDARTYRDLVSPAGLREVATFADAIGVAKALVVAPGVGSLGEAPLVAAAHAVGLAVHVWTLRSDAPFLPREFAGDARAEWRHYARLGVDGMFGDFPADGVAALRGGR